MGPGASPISDRWMVRPGQAVRLAELDAGSTSGAPGDKAVTSASLPDLTADLSRLQDRLWAENRRSLLVVLQAMDAGGKDGTIKHVFTGVNPQATRVTAFKQPNQLEARHDFLWRVHRAVPAAGEIGIFNRSHYEDVLVVRVHRLVETSWKKRFRLINAFEETLHASGTTIVKLYLHISKDEQRRRLEERIETPDKRWKIRPADLEERAYWGDYQAAYEDALSHTSTRSAPWYVIPADRKWYRNWAVSNVLVDTLHRLDPRYPQPLELPEVRPD